MYWGKDNMPITYDSKARTDSPRRSAGSPVAAAVADAAVREVPDVLQSVNSCPDGLNRAQALARRARDGFNEIASEKPHPWYVQLLHAFHTPFTYLLLTLAAVAIVTEDQKAAVIISVMVALSGSLRFWQEYRSGQAAEKLRALVRTTATVSRPDPRSEVPPDVLAAFELKSRPLTVCQEEIPIRDLVPGDVVHLSAGDLIPADLRLLTAKDLFVSQAALTGESMPVEKADVSAAEARRLLDARAAPLELPNVCFLGTTVVSGTAKAVVVATGDRTYLGSLARHLVGKRAETAFDKGVRGVSWLLIRFMLVMVPVVFLLNGFTKGDWGEAFLFGVAVAVGLTPEMLPMIVTANLARGAVAMSRRKVIVKRLPAIQNLGAMDVLCTDKTGTLTQDKVVLIRHLDVDGNECEEVLEYAYLNSYFQTGLKNLLDRAVLEHEDLTQTRELTQRYIKYDEVPFDFHRRRMSVVVHEVFQGRELLICKGAAEEVLAVCSEARVGGQAIPLTDAVREQVMRLRTDMNEDGLRVIAVAVKQVWSRPNKQYGVADEDKLTLVGFVAFLDPPKESATPALAALARHGVAVKILTGDNDLVARKVCKAVGLPTPRTLLGHQLEAMTEDELEQEAEEVTLFAKLNPSQKARIIAALKRRGHTVGFLGDGINDAPALREADAGVSVDTGADIAKESADVILLEKSLLVLEDGVELGRQTYGNTIKYINKMTASSNFGNVFSVLVASAWLPFLPMLAIHLLIQNLLYDVSQIGIPFDRMDDEYLEMPRRWQVNDLGRFMLFLGPISSIFDITTFCVMYFVFAANSPEAQALFQSGWFVKGLLSQTLIIHMIRTAKAPFIESTAAAPLLVLTLGVMAVGVAVPFSPLGAAVGLVPLPPAYFPWLAGTLLCYCLLTQVVKRWYIRKFGMWL
jgi:Mg2+-importing ATPase